MEASRHCAARRLGAHVDPGESWPSRPVRNLRVRHHDVPDIDLHLIPDVFSRHHKAVEILNGLIHQDWWNTFTLGDWVQDRFRAAADGSVTRGYFLRLAGFFEGGRWNVDAWLLDPAKYSGDVWAPRMAGITPEQRLDVPRIKEARARGALRATGVAIYTAVLDHQIATEAFVDWQRRTSGDAAMGLK